MADKIATNKLLVLTWTAVVMLIGSTLTGFILVAQDNNVWPRLVFSLAVVSELIVLVGALVYIMFKVRMED